MKNLNDLSYEELKSLLDNNAKFNGIVFNDYTELLSMDIDNVLLAAGKIFRDYSLGNTVYTDYVRFQYYPDIEKINAWINDPETCILCFSEELPLVMETWAAIDNILDAFNYDEISLTRETEQYLNAAYDEYKERAETLIAAAFTAYFEDAEDNDVLANYLSEECDAGYNYTDYYINDAGQLYQRRDDLLIA